jgi:phenylacetate-CoA ligase
MSDAVLRLYHRLPAPLRSAAATARGQYLRMWRYGPEMERLVAEARQREYWGPERWHSWREERLASLLHRAATQVPYYREEWLARRRRGDRASWEVLENWPLLEKEPLRAHPTAFVADDCDVRRMYPVHTSGTTGKPLELWRRRATVRGLYALSEVRDRGWNGVSRDDRWAMLGGQLVTPVGQRRPPFWIWNGGLNQLYMSSYHLASDLIPYYLDALQRYRVRYLWGYTSSLHALAQEVARLGRRDLRMEVAITNAEPVFEYQREAIASAFQCPVRQTYGMAEMAAAASECPCGSLHLWPEVGWIEVLDGDQPVANGAPGDLVCTGLMNTDMPLIRYRVRDRGTLSPAHRRCGCGRTLPMLASLEGRIDDVLYTTDGRRIGRLDPVFKANLPVHEAQIVQEALKQVRVRYVPAADCTPEALCSIVERLQTRMGPVEVIFEPVGEVPRTPNGKFRAVICDLPAAQKEALSRGPAGCRSLTEAGSPDRL